MRHFTFLFVISFFLGSCCFQCRPEMPSNAPTEVELHLTYVQLYKRLTMDVGDTELTFGTWSAGGVCVENAPGGCFVLTADHFCESSLEDVLGEAPVGYNFSPAFDFSFEGRTILGEGGDAWVVSQDPTSDLCLIWVEGEFFDEVPAIANENLIEDFAFLQNWGSPYGYFNSYPDWSLLLFEGYWGGWCQDFCRLPGIENVNNFFMHSIPTSRGQSGSAIFLDGALFGIQVASNLNIESFGIAARPSIINEFLLENNIQKVIYDSH